MDPDQQRLFDENNGTELGAHDLIRGWIRTAFFLAAAVFVVPFGRIADSHGMKRIFRCGSGFTSDRTAA